MLDVMTAGHAYDVETEHDAGPDEYPLDGRLTTAVGYRVAAPEGDVGVVAGVPLVGHPPRPLVLVVRNLNTIRFVSLRRVAAVVPDSQRVLLRAQDGRSRSGEMEPSPHSVWDRGAGTIAEWTTSVPCSPTERSPELNTVSAERADSEGVLVTADGYEQCRNELETLRTDRRRELSERLREAREDGNLADNPALLDLFEEQARLERRIAIL
jgi:hypothetical protein